MRRGRAVTIVLAALLVLPVALAQDNEPETARDRCERPERVHGIGDACRLPSGLLEVFAPDGSSLGFTHGTDPRCDGCPEPAAAAAGSQAPHCVTGAAGEYYIHVIYARASNDQDRFSTMAPTIRSLVGQSTAIVDDAAIATSDRAQLRVLCNAGTVVVENAVLPTQMASASFSTIVSDLRTQGYTDGRQKYWVFYDDPGACACAGTGHVYIDDRDSIDNFNNGNAQAMFAVTFGAASVRVWLHELGHNLGAVQMSAPHTTSAGPNDPSPNPGLHCVDGLDIMCYNDGGARGSQYSSSVCAVEVFDCNKDDYCHANPPAGSYLDTHWQACHRQSRFVRFGEVNNVAPTMTTLTCTPQTITTDQTLTCSFSASDSSPGVFYTVTWGDGQTTRVPSSATVAPGTTQQATHQYASTGSRTVSVTATDSGSPALSSGAMTFGVTVDPGNAAPTVQPISCTPTSPLEDQAITCTFSSTDPEGNAVFYTLNWRDGTATERVPSGSGTVAPTASQSRSHTYANPGTYTLGIVATDTAGKVSAERTLSIAVQDTNLEPVLDHFSCPVAAEPNKPVTCSVRATDSDSTGVRYQIAWGDGQSTTYPASGFVAGGVLRTVSHTYASTGNRTVTVTATDNATVPATSAPRTANIRLEIDLTPPSVGISEPRNGVLYQGCGSQTNKATGRPLFFMTGCAKVQASDSSGIARVELWQGNELLAIDTVAPYDFEFPVGVASAASYTVVAVDNHGRPGGLSFNADTVGLG